MLSGFLVQNRGCMLEQYFKKPETCDRIRASWLFEPIQRYVTWLHDQNYAERNVQARVPLLIQFADHAHNRGAKSWPQLAEHVASFVEQWVHDRSAGREAEDPVGEWVGGNETTGRMP
jgi:hypothetical protein